MQRKEDVYRPALIGKKLPILTLDNKWYKLFANIGTNNNIKRLEGELNELLKRQGKLTTESKDIKAIKKKLVAEIVPMVDDLEQSNDNSLFKKLDEKKRLIEDCNDKLDGYKEELVEIPARIEQVNLELMVATMEFCYDVIQRNTDEIQDIAKWIATIRDELKENIIKKQEKEIKNHDIYAYMHTIFGIDVMDIFDLRYNPEKQHPTNTGNKAETAQTVDNMKTQISMQAGQSSEHKIFVKEDTK